MLLGVKEAYKNAHKDAKQNNNNVIHVKNLLVKKNHVTKVMQMISLVDGLVKITNVEQVFLKVVLKYLKVLFHI